MPPLRELPKVKVDKGKNAIEPFCVGDYVTMHADYVTDPPTKVAEMDDLDGKRGQILSTHSEQGCGEPVYRVAPVGRGATYYWNHSALRIEIDSTPKRALRIKMTNVISIPHKEVE